MRKSEGRGLFASLVSSAADKGKKLSMIRGRTARVSAESTVPLTQQSTLSTASTVSPLASTLPTQTAKVILASLLHYAALSLDPISHTLGKN